MWIFEDKGQLEVDFASKSIFEITFFLFDFHWHSKELSKIGNNSEKKGFRKKKSIKQWKKQKIVLPNEYFLMKIIRKIQTFLTLKIKLESQIYALFDDPFEIQWKSDAKKI